MALCLGDDPSWRDEKPLAHLSTQWNPHWVPTTQTSSTSPPYWKGPHWVTTHAPKKPSGAFGVVFQGWLGEREKGTEEKKKSSVSSIPCNQLMQWSFNKKPKGKSGARWWLSSLGLQSNGEQRVQAGNEEPVHKLCYLTGCDKCGRGKAVAVPVRPEVQSPVSSLSTRVGEGSSGQGESQR